LPWFQAGQRLFFGAELGFRAYETFQVQPESLETIGVGHCRFMIRVFSSFISLLSAAYPPMSQLLPSIVYNNARAFCGRSGHSLLSRSALFLLFALAWNSLTFCGEIHEAAKAGDLETVKTMLKSNSDLVFSESDYGSTPLHLAAAYGKKDVALLLLASRAEVNAKDRRGRTPLHRAAEKGCKELLELLLANHAEVNAKDRHGSTPLHEAAISGCKEEAALLLTNKAEVNAKGYAELTPLAQAAANGHKELVELLLANHADVNATNGSGSTPLTAAVDRGDTEIVALLLTSKANVNAKKYNRDTALHLAVVQYCWTGMNCHKDIAALLLDNHADVNAEDREGRTPLGLAVRLAKLRVPDKSLHERHKELAELLRQHGGHE
jgi:ankyrin repeat protein